MARKDRRTPAGAGLRALLEAGDHRGARRAAQAVLADPAAGEEDRAEASRLLASLAPDPGVVAAGLVAVAIALALALWAIVAG